MCVFRFYISALICLSALALHAQPATPAKNIIKIEGAIDFSVTAENGKPLVVKFEDGREATLQIRELRPLQFEIPLRLEESTCSAYKPKKCHLGIDVQKTDLALRWTKNLINPERLNKDLVNITYDSEINEDFMLVNFDHAWRPEFQTIYSNKAQNLKWELICDDYRFITGSSDNASAPDDLKIVDWANETMALNPETNTNENRAFQGAMNINFKRTAENTLLLSDVGQVTNSAEDAPLLFFGDIIGWTVQSSQDHDLCQVSFKPDVGAIMGSATKMLEDEEAKTPFRPFAPDSDKILWAAFLRERLVGQADNELDEPFKTLSLLRLITTSYSSIDALKTFKITPMKVK